MATGMDTRIGEIAKMMASEDTEAKTLSQDVDEPHLLWSCSCVHPWVVHVCAFGHAHILLLAF